MDHKDTFTVGHNGGDGRHHMGVLGYVVAPVFALIFGAIVHAFV
jgi:hypothetical protein